MRFEILAESVCVENGQNIIRADLKCNKVKPVVFMHCYHFPSAYCGHK